MDYVVNLTKQIATVAETPEEAIKKAMNGEGQVISTNVGANPRPQPQTRTAVSTGVGSPALQARQVKDQ
jgi:hypothetical protein